MRVSRILFTISAVLVGGILGTAAEPAGNGVTGRYVHISIPGRGILSLAEVQVFRDGKNIAAGKATRQTSTSHRGVSSRAVDGKTSGDWDDATITHTAEGDKSPAWEVDLGREVGIDTIAVWNRNGLERRLNNARVLVLNADRIPVWGAVMKHAGKGEIRLDTKTAGTISKLGSKPLAFTVSKVKPSSKRKQPLPYRSNDYSISPDKNRGILNGPLMARKRPAPKDPRLSLKQAIEDLLATHGEAYPDGREFLARLNKMESADDPDFEALKREALLANPLLDFDSILLIKRKGTGMPANWQGNSSLRKRGSLVENELLSLNLKTGTMTRIYKPAETVYAGQFDLHYDADRIVFTSLTKARNWAIFEIRIDPKSGAMVPDSLRQVSPDMGKDIDSYDPVYLPDGKIIFVCSTSYSGVPCVGGRDFVGNLHVMNPDGSDVRRLTFDQDNDWNPVVMDNGRVMYLRWEYTDSAHYFSRVMMYMNQDGTDQKGFYGSNSYWPNSMFFPKPIPGSASKFVAIVGSHHGARRSGPLVLFDAAKGRHEADGAVQVIGESGQAVQPIVHDRLARQYRPHYLTPYPLSEKYFIAAINKGGWKICLVDVFDNILILKDEPGWSLLEPVPLRKRVPPPVVASRVRPGSKEGTIWISDIHFGPGLKGVPKGTAKALRVLRYEYAPRRSGGHYAMGMESGWDARQILGTVPLEADGSVMVKVPANTPISVQPLDADGKALQIMRSWMVARPGETLSCVGCHENPDTTPLAKPALAARKPPKELTPWYGEARGFSYKREVQPAIDKFCVGCHAPEAADKPAVAKLTAASTGRWGTGVNTGKLFRETGLPDLSTPEASHRNLHPYVRRNGPEGDYHLLTPLEFHADTSELVQMLAKGHHNVKLDSEAWDRLITWMDLNAPYHGTWTEAGARKEILERRLALRKRYAGVEFNPEKIVNSYEKKESVIMPKPRPAVPDPAEVKGWPFDAAAAGERRGTVDPMTLDLGDEVMMKLVRIPAGSFPMGSNDETPMEAPVAEVRIPDPFWMATTEVTLEQYRQFDPDYLNGVYDMHYKDQVKRGYYMNHMKFPVIRVSWQNANAFCAWLSERTGKEVWLPTEAQWEWACRAGSATPFWYGDLDTDFAPYANLADVTRRELAVKGVNPKPIRNPKPHLDFELKDNRFYDKSLHLAPVASYRANFWGLFDMHGNVAEWTASAYQPYPYKNTELPPADTTKRVVRGGSWNDRPHRSTSSYRLGFSPWYRVFNVGFRVIVSE